MRLKKILLPIIVMGLIVMSSALVAVMSNSVTNANKIKGVGSEVALRAEEGMVPSDGVVEDDDALLFAPETESEESSDISFEGEIDENSDVELEQEEGVSSKASAQPAFFYPMSGLKYTGKAQSLGYMSGTVYGTTYYSTTVALSGTVGNTYYGYYGSTTVPTKTDAGTYTVYYFIKSNSSSYNDKSGSASVTIAKASQTITFNPTSTSISLTYGTSYGFTVTASGGGSLSISSSLTGLVSASITAGNAMLTCLGCGSTVSVTVTAASNTNYNSATKTITVTPTKATLSSVSTVATVSAYSGTYNGSAHSATITPKVSMTVVSGSSTSYGTTVCSSKSSGTYSLSPSRTSAGTTTVYYKISGMTNYNDYASSTTVTINQASSSLAISMSGYTYGETKSSPSQTQNTSGATATYYYNTSNSNSGGTAWTNVTSSTYLNAGTYYMYATTPATTNYKAATSATVSFTISKATNPGTVSGRSLTYNASYQNLSTVSNAQGGVYYSTSKSLNGSNYTEGTQTIPTGINAGTYTVYYYIAGNTNYNAKNGNVSTSIAKIANPGTVSGRSLTYSGSNQNLATVSSAQGTVYYSTSTSLTSSNYSSSGSTTIPTGKNAGTYTVYYYIAGNTNYNAKNGNVSTTIAKASSSITVSSSTATVTYGSSAAATASTNSGGTLSVKSSNTSYVTVSITAGNIAITCVAYTSSAITVTVSAGADSNHNAPSNKTITVTTAKAGISPSVNMSGYTYGGTKSSPSVSGNSGGGTVTYYYNTSNSASGGTAWTNVTSSTYLNVGTYYMYATVAATTNYNGATTATKSFTISKGTMTATVYAGSGTYNGSAKYASISTGYAGAKIVSGTSASYGTTVVSSAVASTVYSLSPGRTSAGTTTVYYKLTLANYNDLTGTTTVTVSKASSSLTVSSATATVAYGSSTTVTVSTDGGGSIITSSNATSYVTVSGTTTLTISCVAYRSSAVTITVSATADGNHNAPANKTITVTPAKRAITIKADSNSKTYDGSALTDSGYTISSGSLASGDSLTTVSISGSITNAGSVSNTVGTVTIKKSSTDVTSYYSITKTNGTLTVNKASSSITVSSATATVTYGSSGAATASTTSGGTLSVKSSNTSYVTVSITAGNIVISCVAYTSNTITVTVSATADDNHNAPANKTITVTPAKRAITIKADSNSKTYNGVALTDSGYTISSGSLASGDSLTTVSISGSITNAGSVSNTVGTVTIKKSSTDVTSYYSITKTNGTLTVNKASSSITVGSATATVTYGSSVTVLASTDSGGTLSVKSSNTSYVTVNNTNGNIAISCVAYTSSTITVTVSAGADGNHNAPANKTITVTPAKRAITIKANSNSKTYNGSELKDSGYAISSGSLASGDSLTVSISGSITNVGSVSNTVGTVTIKKSSTDVTSYYSITKTNGTLTVSQADNPGTVSGRSLTYNASYQNLSTVSNAQGGVYYSTSKSLNGSNYTEGTQTIPTGLNAGSYTVHYYIAGNSNYKAKNGSVSTTIAKAGISPSVSMSGYAYGGTKSTPSVSGNSGGGAVTYYYNTSNSASGGTAWTNVTSSTSLNAGTYYMYATIAATSNYNGATTATKSFTISKGTMTATVTAGSGTYNGNAKSATISTSYAGAKIVSGTSTSYGTTVVSSAVGAQVYNLSPSRTDAGTTTVYYKLTLANYNDLTGTTTVSISKADSSISLSTTSIAGIDYNATSKPTATPSVAGTWSVTSSSSTHISASMSTTATASTATTITLTGKQATANKVTITVTLTPSSSNYSSSSKTITVSAVNKITNTGTVSGKSLTYTGSAQTLASSSNAKGAVYYYTEFELTESNYSIYGSTTAPTATTAATYTVYYYIVGDTNHKAKSGSVTATIGKATPTITLSATTIASIEYDATSSQTAKPSVAGTWSVTSSSSTHVSASMSTTATANTATTITLTGKQATTNATTISITLTPTDTTNYNRASTTITVSKVTKKATTVTLSPSATTISIPYGDSYGITTKSNSDSTTLTATSSLPGLITTDVTANHIMLSCVAYNNTPATITITVAETTNYTAKTIELLVNPAQRELVVTSASKTKVFDAEMMIADGFETSGLAPGDTAYVTNEGVIFDAGSVQNTIRSVVIKNSSETDVTGYYSITKKHGTLTVEKAPIIPTIDSMGNYYYSGTISMPSVGGNTGNGDVTYYYNTTNSNSGGTAWSSLTKHLDAGNYYMYAIVATTKNYKSGVTPTTPFTILKSLGYIELSSERVTIAYGDTIEIEASALENATLSVESAIDNVNAKVLDNGNIELKAGLYTTQTVTITVSSAETKNYTAYSRNIIVTLAKRAITFTANSAQKVYDGSALTDSGYSITSGSLAEYDLEYITVSGSIINVGSVDNIIESVRIMNGGADTTFCYTITNEKGTLTISQADGYLVFGNVDDNKIVYGSTDTFDVLIESSHGGTISLTTSPDGTTAEILSDKIVLKGLSTLDVGTYRFEFLCAATNNYKQDYSTYDLEVIKANGYIILSKNEEDSPFPTAAILGEMTLVKSHHGGALSVTDDHATATCKIEDGKWYIENLTGLGAGTTITLTFTSAATTNYTAASAQLVYTITPGDIEGDVEITGLNVKGETLTATIPSPTIITYTYKWFRDEVEISGATNQTYTLTADDLNKTISVEVFASRENYNSETWTDTTDATNNRYDKCGVALTIARQDVYGAMPHTTDISASGSDCVITTAGSDIFVTHEYSNTAVDITVARVNDSYQYMLVNNSSGTSADAVDTFTTAWTPTDNATWTVSVHELFEVGAYLEKTTVGISDVSVAIQLEKDGEYTGDYTGELVGHYVGLQFKATLKAGYSFDGWYDNDAGTGTAVSTDSTYTYSTFSTISKPVSEDVILYAKASIVTYSITYDLAGGTVSPANPTGYDITTSDITLNNPTRTGYKFTGWTGTGLSEATKEVIISQGSTGDRSYTANWDPIEYIVKFDAKGGTGKMADQPFKYDEEKALTSNVFEKDEYAFGGWTTTDYDTNSTTVPTAQYSDGKEVKNLTSTDGGEVTLYAVWVGTGYTVHIYKMNTSGAYPSGYLEKPMDATPGTTLTVATEVARMNVLFDGGLELDTEKTTDNEFTVANNNSTTVTIYIKRLQHTLTLDANGGTFADDKTTTSKDRYYEQAYGIWEEPTRAGYDLSGWADSKGNAVSTDTDMGTSDITIYAQWTPHTFAIVFNGNSHTSGSTESVPATYDTTATLTTNGFERTGHGFAGWATSANGSKAYDDGYTLTIAEVNALYPGENEGTVTLYAVWNICSYTLTLDANGGTFKDDKTTTTKSVVYAQAYGTLSTPTRTGYGLSGWADSEGNAVSADTIMGASNTTIYAQWTAHTFTIAFDGNDHTSGSTASVPATYDTTATLTSNGFERTGYTFSGWATSANGSKAYDDGANLTIAQVNTLYPGENEGTVTLYAVWTMKNATVTIQTSTNYAEQLSADCSPSGTYTIGDTLTLKFTANTNFWVYRWYKYYGTTKIEELEVNTTYTITPQDVEQGNVRFVAVAAYNWYMISATNFNSDNGTGDGTGGYISSDWDAGNWFAYRNNGQRAWQTAMLYAKPNDGYKFVGWYLRVAPTATNYKTIMLASAEDCTLSDDGTYYTYTFSPNTVNPADGQIGGGYFYALFLSEATLTVNPNGGTWNNSTTSQQFTQDYASNMPIGDAIREGHTFNGWTYSGAYNGIYDSTIYTLSGSNFYTISDEYEYYDKYTVGVWAYHSTWTTTETQIILSCTNSGGWNIRLVDTGAVQLEILLSSIGWYTVTDFGTGLSAGWHHFAYTFDGRYVNMYLDGKHVNTIDGGQTTTITEEQCNNPYIIIGAECGYDTNSSLHEGGFFTGKIGRILLANETYNQSAIAQLTHTPEPQQFNGANGMYDSTEYTLTGSNYYTISDEYEYYDKYTVGVWAYHDTWTTSSTSSILSCTNSGGWSIELVSGNKVQLNVVLSSIGSYSVVEFGNNLSAGWHHFAYTFDGRYVKMYLDGKYVNMIDAGANTTIKEEARSNPYIIIGAECGSTPKSAIDDGNYWTGKIGRILLANTTYNESAIAQLAGQSEPYPFNGGANGMYDNTIYTLTGSNYYTISDEYEYYDKYTVGVWAYHDTWTTSSAQKILSCTNNGGWYIALRNTNQVQIPVRTANMSGYYYQTIGTGLSAGWHHFAYTFDGRYLSYYLDGAPVGIYDTGSNTTIVEETQGNPYIIVGGECGYTPSSAVDDGEHFTGKIGKILLVNSSYSASQIAELANTSASYQFMVTDGTMTAKWIAHTYDIKYNANGGTGTMDDSTHTYDIESRLTANAFSYQGYVFAGWNTSADGSGTYYSDKAVIKNLTTTNGALINLYAQWVEPSYYTVGYNTGYIDIESIHGNPTINGSQVSGLSNTNYLQQSAVTGGTPWFSNDNWELGVKLDNSHNGTQETMNTRGVGSQYGINFMRSASTGWSIYYSTDGSSWAKVTAIPVPTDVDAFTWIKLSANDGVITISYSYDGASYTTATTLNGNPYTTTSDKLTIGNAWGTNHTGNTVVDFSDTYVKVNGSLVWGQQTGGKTVTYAATYGDLATPTRVGYTFAGWKKNIVDLRTLYPSHANVTPTSATSCTVTATNPAAYTYYQANITHLLQVGKTYKLTYTVSGNGTPTCRLDGYNASGTRVNISVTSITVQEGYTYYIKVYANSIDTAYSGTVNITYSNILLALDDTVDEDSIVDIAGDHTLTASWTAKTYTVTLDANGGSVSPESVTVTHDSTYGDLPIPTRTGYTFNGWKKNYFDSESFIDFFTNWRSGDASYDPIVYANGEIGWCGPTGHKGSYNNKNVHAIWKPTMPNGTYKVSYYGRSGTDGYTTSGLWAFNLSPNGNYYGIESYDSTPYLVTSAGCATVDDADRKYYEYTFTKTDNFAGFGLMYSYGYWTYFDNIKIEMISPASGVTEEYITSTTPVTYWGDQTLTASWTANSYKVNFDANGGSVSQTSDTVIYGQTYGTHTNIYPSNSASNFSWLSSTISLSNNVFTVNGTNSGSSTTWYAFCSHNNTALATIQPGATYTYVLEVLTWTGNNLTFNIGHTHSSDLAQLSETDFNVTGTGTYIAQLSGTGYSSAYLSRDFISVPAGSTAAGTFRISLFNGVVTKDEFSYVAPGQNLTTSKALPTPTRTGYTFNGWKLAERLDLSETWENGGLAAADGEEFNSVYSLRTDTYIKVKPNTTYIINISSSDLGLTAIHEFTSSKAWVLRYPYSSGTKTTATITTSATTGYLRVVVGTKDDSNAALNMIDSSVITLAEADATATRIASSTIVSTARDHRLVATWTPITYSISYDLAGGTVATDNPTTYNIESDAITLINPTRAGYDFAGWTGTGLSGATINVTIPNGSIGNRTYTATWTKSKVAVTWDATTNGGTYIGDASTNFYYLETYSAPNSTQVTKTGYSFDGWFTEATGGTMIFDSEGAIIANVSGYTDAEARWIKYDSGVTLYAQFSINQYILTVKPMGGTWDDTTSDSIISQDYGSTITIADPTRVGYKFNGWTLTDGGSFDTDTKNYTFGASNGTLTANWTPIEYTIIFNAMGGTGTMAPQPFKYDEEKALKSNAFSYEGSTFGGWTTSTYDLNATPIPTKQYSDSQVIKNLTSTDGTEITLYAIWVGAGYTAQIYTMNVAGEYPSYTEEQREFTPGTELDATAEATNMNLLVENKFEFDYATDVNGNELADNKFTVANNNSTIIKIYIKRVQHTLTLDATGGTFENGQSTTTKDLRYEQAYGELTIPERAGYEFVGWTDASGNTVGANTDMGAEDVTIFAQWATIGYTITYDLNGGTVATNPTTYDVTTGDFTLNNPTKTGYTFTGWTGTGLAQATMTVTITQGSTGNRTYTANWTVDTFTITFDGNGHTSGSTASITATYDAEATLTLNGFNREGYSFAGWAISATDGKVHDNGATLTVDEVNAYYLAVGKGQTYTLYAVWNGNGYTITLDANGGSSITPNVTGYTTSNTDQTLTLVEQSPIRIGHRFTGWAIVEDCNPGLTIQGNDIKIPANAYGNIKLQAQFSINQYTLTVKPMGGTWDNSTADVSVVENYNTTIEIKDPTREGYDFDGWTLTGGGNFDKDTNKYTFGASDAVLTALWTSKTYTITLDYQGGTDNWFNLNGVGNVSGTFENDTFENVTTNAKFNGENGYQVALTDTATELFNLDNIEGSYKVSMYVRGNANNNIKVYFIETTENEIIAEQTIALQSGIWQYVTMEFDITADYAGVEGLIVAPSGNITCHFDDIKVMRVDNYTPISSYNYTIETELTQLPHAVKAGYTFLGWNTKADGTGNKVTSYGGGDIESAKYYAIYKLSNPTATVSVDNATITYAGDDATISAVVNTEGLDVDTTYQWYRNSEIINQATSSTYVHESNSLDIGTYTYYCIVTTTKDNVTSSSITSTSVVVTVEQASTVLEIEMYGYTYGDEITSPTVKTNSSNAQVTFYYGITDSVTDGVVWTNMTSTTLDAREYYMYARTPATTNYGEGVSNVVKFVVAKGTIIVQTSADDNATKTAEGNNITYTSQLDSDGLTARIGATNVNTTVEYWIDEADKTEASVNAGEFTKLPTVSQAQTVVYNYTISADNYNSVSGTITLVVQAKEVTVHWTVSDSYTYNGQDQSASVKAEIDNVNSGKIVCEVEFTVNGETAEFKNAGTYTATAKLTGDSANNYTLSGETKQIVINKFVVEITAENKEMVYGGEAPEYTYSASETTPDTYTTSYKIYEEVVNGNETVRNDVTGQEADLPTGTYIIVPSVTLSDSNYTITYEEGELTVISRQLTKPSVSGEYTYNGSEQTAQLNNFDSQTMIIIEGNKATNAGNYQVEVELKDKSNYTWSDGSIDNIKLDWSIAKYNLRNATIAEIGAQSFNGAPITPTPAVTTGFGATLTANVDFTYGYSNNTNTTTEAILTITAVENSNYTGTKTATWEIQKATVELTLETSSITVRRGETETVDVAIVLDYAGNLNGQTLTLSRGTSTGEANITATEISNNISTITIQPTMSGEITLQIQYAGDSNHSASEVVTLKVIMPSINISVVVLDGVGGDAKLNGVIEGSVNEVTINSSITFEATPDEGYGLISYTVANGEEVYVEKSNNKVDGVFTSPSVTIDDILLGNETGKENSTVTIQLKFEEVVTLDVNVDEARMSIDTDKMVSTYSDNNAVAYTYENNKLTTFKNSTIGFEVEAIHDNNQYYVINEVTIGEDTKTINRPNYTVSKDINDLVDDEGNVSSISISATKVYNADERQIVPNVTVNIQAEESADNVPSGYINDSRYIIEGAKVYYNIVEENPNYDFYGMKIGDNVIFKADLGEAEWSYDNETNTRTWYQESFSNDISTAEPIMLERWYTADSQNGKVVNVAVAEGISAYLQNIIYDKVGQSYTLRNNVFNTGSDPLYAGTWQVTIDSLTVNDYTLEVLVYKGDGDPVDYGTSQFKVDSSVTKVEITIRTLEVNTNGSGATLRNTVSGESTTLTNNTYTIDSGVWQVVVDDPTAYEVEVRVYTTKQDSEIICNGTEEFTVGAGVYKVEIQIQPIASN